MKNQYFGDTRDLFKYDLIEFIFSYIPTLDFFRFIALLTKDDNSNEGMQVNYNKAKAGYKNSDLISFLYQQRKADRRLITIEKYFESRSIDNVIVDSYFTNENRNVYFHNILNEIQKAKNNSLLFFDPDNGLEVKHNNEKHVLFEEIRPIYELIDENSIIMIYQHIPRVNRDQYIAKRIDELSTIFSSRISYISDNSIVFFLIAKSDAQFENLKESIQKYSSHYPKLKSAVSLD